MIRSSYEQLSSQETEAKWQKRWRESGVFKVDLGQPGEKYYNLTMFPILVGTNSILVTGTTTHRWTLGGVI